ncbi:MAG: RnfABCDGE type electron transport complex subunit G [Salinivirgaceae bacterium]
MAKRESTFGNMVITLFAVTFIASATLGGIYELTKEPIKKALQAKKEASIKQVLPEFDKLESYKVLYEEGGDSLEFNEAYLNGEHIGTAIETYTDNGFSGRFKIMVGFLPNGNINNTAVLEHKETPGLGDKMEASKGDFPDQFKGLEPTKPNLTVKKDGGKVDAITAATITSRAFCDAIERANKALKMKGGTK